MTINAPTGPKATRNGGFRAFPLPVRVLVESIAVLAVIGIAAQWFTRPESTTTAGSTSTTTRNPKPTTSSSKNPPLPPPVVYETPKDSPKLMRWDVSLTTTGGRTRQLKAYMVIHDPALGAKCAEPLKKLEGQKIFVNTDTRSVAPAVASTQRKLQIKFEDSSAFETCYRLPSVPKATRSVDQEWTIDRAESHDVLHLSRQVPITLPPDCFGNGREIYTSSAFKASETPTTNTPLSPDLFADVNNTLWCTPGLELTRWSVTSTGTGTVSTRTLTTYLKVSLRQNPQSCFAAFANLNATSTLYIEGLPPVAVGTLSNPGSPQTLAVQDSGGRLGGKDCFTTPNSSDKTKWTYVDKNSTDKTVTLKREIPVSVTCTAATPEPLVLWTNDVFSDTQTNTLNADAAFNSTTASDIEKPDPDNPWCSS